MSAVVSIIGAVLPVVERLLGELIEDPDKRAEAREKLLASLTEADAKLASERASIVRAEIGSSRWLAATWRPLLMLTFGAVVFNNLILAPYVGAIFGASVYVPLPERAWDLMSIGVGGYIVGRTGEKVISTWSSSPRSSASHSLE